MNSTSPATIAKWLERTTAALTEVVFPPVCAGCGRLGTILCEACIAEMVLVEGALCHRCGRILPDTDLSPSELCTTCAAARPLLTQVRAPFLYVEPTSRLIHRLKYDGYFALAKPLAATMSNHWPVWAQPPELMLPVPLHKRRRRQRGFNQSALLAKYLARETGIEFDEKSLRRHRHTQPQIKLGPEARYDNVAGAFEADADRVSGRHIVLVDDVYTTGATMTAAADALINAGALSVSGYCLARVS